jgi:hypothetical protein
VRKRIGRHRGAVTHLEGLRHRVYGAREQQGQRRRGVARVRGREVVGLRPAGAVQAATHLHQLGRALGFPELFLFTRQLHAHRCGDGARQQQGIGGHVVGAVAAVAAAGFQPDHVDGRRGQADQARQIGAQHMRVLRARPHRAVVALPMRHRTTGADGGVQLIGPDIVAVQPRRRRRQGLPGVALVEHHPRRRRVGPQGRPEVGQRRPRRQVGPGHGQLAHRQFGNEFVLGDHADEVADHHRRCDAVEMGDRRCVDAAQAASDEFPGVTAGIRRPHDSPMAHARQPEVVHVDGFAAHLGRQVQPRQRLADQALLVGRPQRRRQVQQQLDMAAGEQLGLAELPAVCRTQPARRELDRVGCHGQAFGGLRDQPGPRLRRRRPERRGVDLDRGAGDRRALVGAACGVAQHHLDALGRQHQLFGHQLPVGGRQPGAQVDMTGQQQHAAVVGERQQHLGAFGRVGGYGRGLARGRRGRRRRFAQHQQHPVGRTQRRPRAQGGQLHRAGVAACGWTATMACRAACRISSCVPQRHRLCDSSARTRCSLGCGSRASSATSVITMPLRQ